MVGCSRWPRPRSSRPTPVSTSSGSRPSAVGATSRSSRTDEFGLRTVIARVEAGDAVWVEAILARVAEIIAPRVTPTPRADELRSIAFGWLARPAELLALLLEHRDPQEELEVGSRPGRRRSRPTCSTRSAPPTCRRWHRRAVLYVHLHEAAQSRGAGGVARVEGLGPMHADRRSRSLLARTHLTVKPVLDLSDRVRTTAYEHPESLKEQVHLTTGGDYWPYATSTVRTRRLRPPHPIPTPPDHRARPAPTTPARSAADITAGRPTPATAPDSAAPGRYVWLTPHGLGFLVDHRGTRRISAGEARLILDAPPDVDIYPT